MMFLCFLPSPCECRVDVWAVGLLGQLVLENFDLWAQVGKFGFAWPQEEGAWVGKTQSALGMPPVLVKKRNLPER